MGHVGGIRYMTTMRILLLVATVATVLVLLLWRYSVRPSRLIISEDGVLFPTVSGSNLAREELEFPRDFAGELNLLFVPFLREQQAVVNTWIPYTEALESSTTGLVYYELPTIYQMPMVSRTFINEGMRAGIPDPMARERTVTLYVDRDQFMQATGIAGKNDVHILLVDRTGNILWRTVGVFDEEKGQSLRRAVDNALIPDRDQNST